MQNRKGDIAVQNRLLDSVGEGKGGMFWENSIEAGIPSRVKQTTSPGWMHELSARGWCTGKTRRDGMGKEAGEGDRDGEHMWIYGWFMSVYGRNHCSVVEWLASN